MRRFSFLLQAFLDFPQSKLAANCCVHFYVACIRRIDNQQFLHDEQIIRGVIDAKDAQSVFL